MSSIVYYRMYDSPSREWKPIRFYKERLMPKPSDETFDLELKDAQTSSTFPGDTSGVKCNVCVVVKKIYGVSATNKPRLYVPLGTWDSDWNGAAGEDTNSRDSGLPLSREDQDIRSAMGNASKYSHVSQHPLSNQSVFKEEPRRADMGQPPPATYICHRCKKSGHWIKLCPTNGDAAFERTSSQRVPRSYESRTNTQESETYKLKCRTWLKKVIDPNDDSASSFEQESPFQRRYKLNAGFLALNQNASSFVQEHDDDDEATKDDAEDVGFRCTLCAQLFRNAHAMECCYTSYCLECATQHLAANNNTCHACDSDAPTMKYNVNLQRAVDEYRRQHPSLTRKRSSSSEFQHSHAELHQNKTARLV